MECVLKTFTYFVRMFHEHTVGKVLNIKPSLTISSGRVFAHVLYRGTAIDYVTTPAIIKAQPLVFK